MTKGLDPLTRIAYDSLFSITSITIGADTDANGSGTIDFQTRGVTRLQIGNTGTLDVTVPTSGALQAVRLKTNEAGSGDFSLSYFATAGNSGETRRDNQIVMGYNPGGPGFVSGEHSFVESIESRYNTDADILQLEHYFQYNSGTESAISLPGIRPFSITIGLVSGEVATDNMADTVRFWDKNFTGDGAGSPYFKMDMSTTAGEFTLKGNSSISYDGTAAVILNNNGQNILYAVEDLGGGDKRLKFWDGTGGSHSYLNIFAADSVEAGGKNLTLEFGTVSSDARGIRWNGTTFRWQFQLADESWWSIPETILDTVSAITINAVATPLVWVGESKITNLGDGVLRASNNAASGFSRLIFGTDDSSGVALRKSSAVLDVVSGNAGAWAILRASTFDVQEGGTLTISSGVGSVKMSNANSANNAAWIPIKYGGTIYYIPGWSAHAP